MKIVKYLLVFVTGLVLFIQPISADENNQSGFFKYEYYRFHATDHTISPQLLNLLRKDSPSIDSWWWYDYIDLDGIGRNNYLFLFFGDDMETSYEVYKIEGEKCELFWKSPEKLDGYFVWFNDLNGDDRPEMMTEPCGASGRYGTTLIYQWTGSGMKSISVGMGGYVGSAPYDLDCDGIMEIVVQVPIHDDDYKEIGVSIEIYKWLGDQGYVLWKEQKDYPLIDTTMIMDQKIWYAKWAEADPNDTVKIAIGKPVGHEINSIKRETILLMDKVRPIKILDDNKQVVDGKTKIKGKHLVAEFRKIDVAKVMKYAGSPMGYAKVTGVLTDGNLFYAFEQVNLEY